MSAWIDEPSEIFLVATWRDEPIGLAYASVYSDEHKAFLSYFGVTPGRRILPPKPANSRRRDRIPQELTARYLSNRLLDEMRNNDPDLEMLLAEMLPPDHYEPTSDAWGVQRRLLRLAHVWGARWFQGVDYLQPKLRGVRQAREQHLSLVASWPNAPIAASRGQVADILRFVYCRVYLDAYQVRSRARKRPYFEGLVERVLRSVAGDEVRLTPAGDVSEPG